MSKDSNKQHLFYKKPIPLSKERHLSAGLTPIDNDYKFAAKTNSMAINSQEFIEACKCYPIVFTEGENPIPICILGLENRRNLFVSKAGTWDKTAYIPGYVRRYPFAFSEADKKGDKLILCIDEGSARFIAKAKKKDFNFFDSEGKESDLIKSALYFCAQYQNDYISTQAFCKSLAKNKLLKSQNIAINLANDKEPITLSGFQIIDEEACKNISSKLLQEWHKSGYLGLLYQCLSSVANWTKIAKKHG